MLSTSEVFFPSQNEEILNCKYTHGNYDETWANVQDGQACFGWNGGTQPQLECLEVLGTGMLITVPEPLCQRFPLDRGRSGEDAWLITLGAGSESSWVQNTTHI